MMIKWDRKKAAKKSKDVKKSCMRLKEKIRRSKPKGGKKQKPCARNDKTTGDDQETESMDVRSSSIGK
jgi:hypothetical protein